VDNETVMVSVTVQASPDTVRVEVADSNVSCTNVPELEALSTPTFASTTGRESDPFAVNVFVSVAVDVPPVCAYVACARTSPPPPVVISPGSVVDAVDGAVVFADTAR
jgi:hypothetical protein